MNKKQRKQQMMKYTNIMDYAKNKLYKSKTIESINFWNKIHKLAFNKYQEVAF